LCKFKGVRKKTTTSVGKSSDIVSKVDGTFDYMSIAFVLGITIIPGIKLHIKTNHKVVCIIFLSRRDAVHYPFSDILYTLSFCQPKTSMMHTLINDD